MKIKRIICLLTIAASLGNGGCAHWSDQQKRVSSFLLGTAIGVGAGSMASKGSKDADGQATAYAYAAVGMAGGFALGEMAWGGADSKELTTKSAEAEKLLQMDRNEGRILLGDALLKGPSRVKCADGSTSEAAQIFCTDSLGELGNCQDLGFRYISSDLAVAFVGYYSPKGCYPPPYAANPGLKQYFKPLIDQARKEFRK